jgi:UPF0042 nucleotide-binding protein
MYDTRMVDDSFKDEKAAEESGRSSTGEEKLLVVVTGISGAGKGSALKAFEDLGFYSVENLPLELLLAFADLIRDSTEMARAAIVVDVREGPAIGCRQFCNRCGSVCARRCCF